MRKGYLNLRMETRVYCISELVILLTGSLWLRTTKYFAIHV